MSILQPFQLLELNVISAQDLAPVSRAMRSYAVAWVHPDRKLTTRVDTHGRNSPTWNDKFVFRVDDEFLHSDTSAVMIEIYALHWFKDVHVGTVRVLVGNLIPPPSRPNHHHHHHVQLGMRFVALQVRRSSGRPQGILNIGVALLDSSMRSMPLYTQLDTSAVGYRTLTGEDDSYLHHFNHHDENHHQKNQQQPLIGKPELRRTKSDTSSMISDFKGPPKGKVKIKKASSMISGSEVEAPRKKKGSSKASSMINVTELVKMAEQDISGAVMDPPNKIITGSEVADPPKKAKNSKPGSLIDISGAENPPAKVTNEKPDSKFTGSKVVDLTKATTEKPVAKFVNGLPFKPFSKINGLEYGTPRKANFGGRVFLTESELGPSPSEVAATMAKDMYQRIDEGETSVLGAWSLASSVEGLQSKLERWRTELPPVYDVGEYSSLPSTVVNARATKHKRRHTDGGNGRFSCFSNICGLECTIVCGSASVRENGGGSRRLPRSPSLDKPNFV